MKNAFGIEHISKTEEGFRRSHLAAINPRSDTTVREGTNLKRAARYYGGGLAGGVAGALAGRATGNAVATQYANKFGAQIGSGLGRNRSYKKGDVVSRNKKTGQKAKGYIGLGMTGLARYEKEPVAKKEKPEYKEPWNSKLNRKYKTEIRTSKESKKAANKGRRSDLKHSFIRAVPMGAAGGAAVGAGVAAATKKVPISVGAMGGVGGGAEVGYNVGMGIAGNKTSNRNIKSGHMRITNRKTGKKAAKNSFWGGLRDDENNRL